MLPKVEDLGRDGFPYLESAKSRIELQLRESIKRAFGEKSPEYQTHRQLKLAIGPTTEHARSVATVKQLIASLEEKKLELQGGKPSASEASPPPAASPTPRPELTLVPPQAPATTTTEPPPAAVETQPQTITAQPAKASSAPPATPSVSTTPPHDPVQPMATPSPVQQVERPQAAVPKPKAEPIAPDQVSALFRPHETGSVAPIAVPPPQPITAAAASVMTPAVDPTAARTTEEPSPLSAPQEIPMPTQPTSVQQPPVHSSSQPISSTTQEIPVPLQSIEPNSALPTPTITPHESAPQAVDHLELCRRLCLRFHAIARQLKLRGEYRPTLAIEDEIDVQDLLHALLRVQFDDIGTDEWTPSYSHDAPRTTYLLDHDRMAVIVKKTRAGLTAKDLAEQLRLDIEHYRTREHCTALFCFVYDPEGRIGNPRGLEHDLATVSDSFTVDVLVAPK